MDPRRRILLLAAALAPAVACQKSSEQESAEAARAAEIANDKAEQARRELEHGDSLGASRTLMESQEAATQAAREAAQAAKVLAREQEHYRVVLTKEIAWVDRRLDDINTSDRADKEIEAAAHREWRARLVDDLDRVERRPSGADWTELKTRIDHDLDLNRPASVPRVYEKSYGI